MAEFVNNLLDNLMALSWRLLDFPLYILCLGIILLFFSIRFILVKFNRFKEKRRLTLILSVVFGLLTLAILGDYKLKLLKGEMELLNDRFIEGLNENKNPVVSLSEKLQFTHQQKTELSALLPHLKTWERPINEAINLLILRKEQPKGVAYIAMVDLEFPGIELVITPKFERKKKTSDFAKKHKCILAINGEAGETMFHDCALGEWTGNWVAKGKPILLDDTALRPFLSFDIGNQARYFPSSIIDTTYSPEKYNTIWGRFDILVNGQLTDYQNKKPYSRTIMGIDQKGTKLFLMIVDGKRPEYSLGLSYSACAQILKALGASDVMACDQGGSSCMFLQDGLINRPADSDGHERPIYSHFGIRMN